ncbi:MAG TPA: recombinase family protein, partial [Candidatus Methylomirabilis sp.]|nr:recombinase family protein [Candidatus Methylomirabilis sp.]
MSIETIQKVTASHLKRSALLYVRQSTPRQVLENTESKQRQYALRQRAEALGWGPEQIIVIDSDLGQSGATAADREGFQRLVTEVSMDRAGIVMGLEVSRLARNSADWHRLIQICAVTDTLILDEDGIYSPTQFNDRLLLGLKGTMSEAELHLIRSRMQGALLSKAKRGELLTQLPIGFVYDDEGCVVLDPDQQVQQAVRLLFETFRRSGSAYGVVKAFHQQGIRFPKYGCEGGRPTELIWGSLEHGQVVRTLRNPRYAGAYVFGRTRTRKTVDGHSHHKTNVPQENWHSLIQNAHAAYISWQEYEQNLKRLDENKQARGITHKGPPREGCALLQGLVICAVCGSRMQTLYHHRDGNLVPGYRCQGPSEAERTTRGMCQFITGTGVDQLISNLLLEIMTPVALDVALTVQQELQSRLDETDRLRRAQVERARYEADLARRRFLRVDPENRLVADSLEKDWNEKLRALAEAQQNYERQRQTDQTVLNEGQRKQILALAGDFPRLWQNTGTSDRERKRMVRLLIEDVTLRKTEHVLVQIRFKSGMTHSLTVPLPIELNMYKPEVVAEVDRLLEHHTYSKVVALMNERGHRTAEGHMFDSKNLSQLCCRRGLKSRYQRLRDKGLLTITEIAQKLGVQKLTIHKWHHAGLLRGHVYDDR